MPNINEYVALLQQSSMEVVYMAVAPGRIVQFEVEVTSFSQIRSRVVWPESSSPWIDGGMEELMVHFTYATWTSYMLGCAMSLALASQDEILGQTISEMMSHTVKAMGGVEQAEIRMTRKALDETRDGHTGP
jgi:hypothetical protein